jgi:hypothetical protein
LHSVRFSVGMQINPPFTAAFQLMNLRLPTLLISLLATQGPCLAQEAAPKPEPPPELKIQGEYAGKMRDQDFGIQVVAMGGGKYEAVFCPGGLPGAGWTMDPPNRQRSNSTNINGQLRFSANGWSGILKDERIMLEDFKGTTIGRLTRTERRSETLEAPPPEGAVVIFNGGDLNQLQPGAKKTEDGLLMEGCTTKEEFGDCTVHIEFKLPFQPDARGQARGNSGIYLASRYEVQMLDSFGLRGEHNECGGIYTVAKPKVNMCYPPEQWQTYDIDYVAPRFDDKGAKLSNATVTVRHNGVLIHEKVEVPKTTTSAPIATEGPQGPIHLQNHGNPVRYRNFWVKPSK